MRDSSTRYPLAAMVLSLVSTWILACGRTSDSSATLSQRKDRKVGVLLASHGDIDDLSELEFYIKTAFKKNVGIPLPGWVRDPLTNPAYALSVATVRRQYEQIGPTRYTANSMKQVAAVNAALAQSGFPGRAYFGANFTNPLIKDTLDQMRADGVNTIIVFNKGAQFSYASSGENMDDVLEYLNDHKDWDVEAIGRFEYSEDERFREVFALALERDIKNSFPNVPSKDVCLLIGSHGLPAWLTDKGDPAIRQMRRAVAWLRTRLPGFPIYHGFLNDDFFPGAKWAKPTASDAADQMYAEGCPNVLMDGRLSFTTHHRATLYDLNVVAREILEKPDLGPDGQPHPLWSKPKVVLAPNFDDDPNFAQLISQLSHEALKRQGEVLVLKEFGKAPFAKRTVSTPGAYAERFRSLTDPTEN